MKHDYGVWTDFCALYGHRLDWIMGIVIALIAGWFLYKIRKSKR